MKDSVARIVLLVQEFPKTSETFIANKFVGLNQIGKDVHLLCNRSYPENWSKFPGLARNQKLRRRVHVSWPHRSRWIVAFLCPLLLIRCLVRRPRTTIRYLRRGYQKFGVDVFRRFYLDSELVFLKPDLVHFEFGAIAAARMYLASMLDCKIAVSFRGYDLNYVGLENEDHYSDVWEHADILHLLGEDLWRRARRRGCPEYKAKVLISPAVDTTLFRCERETPATAGTSKRPFRVLSVGRLEWKKGYEYALHAVKLLAEKGIKCEYRIIGDGDYLEALMFARQELNLNEIVDFRGALPQAEVRDQMLWADVLLHSAVSEGFCNTVLEAQAMCLPVVCADADGLNENVLHGSTGFVVPRRIPEIMANQLQLLAEQPQLRGEMGSRGRKRVESEFTIGRQIERFSSMYDQLLHSEQVVGGKLPENALAPQNQSL
jgi:colanic acid/amylovoran biosynthesis glycosyltransferase